MPCSILQIPVRPDYDASMKTRGFLVISIRWLLIVFTISGVTAHLYSIRRSVDWVSPNLRHECGLSLGALHIAWRPPEWKLSEERYPPRPGWEIAKIIGSPPSTWWFQTSQLKTWHSVSIPLWTTWLFAAIATTWIWRWDRARVRENYRRWIDWLTPRKPKRLGFFIIAVF